jgi:hypothetical protein
MVMTRNYLAVALFCCLPVQEIGPPRFQLTEIALHRGEQHPVPGRITTNTLGCGDHPVLEGNNRLAARDRALGGEQAPLVALVDRWR